MQWKIFLFMGVVGNLIGLTYDVFRAFRISFKSSGKRFDFVSAQVTDVIFAVVSFCLFTVGVYVFAKGEVRSYSVLGTLAGIGAYVLVLAPVTGRIFRIFFKILYKIFIEFPKKLFTKRS